MDDFYVLLWKPLSCLWSVCDMPVCVYVCRVS